MTTKRTGLKTKVATKSIRAEQSSKAAERERKASDFLKRLTRHRHDRWIESNPSATLSDLLLYLEGVRDELSAFDSDDVLIEISEGLDLAADYLGDFGDLDNPAEWHGGLSTVDDRLADVEEDIGDIEDLIAALGESFKAKRLPKWRARKTG
jgi:hypothetical protein